jgi:hypothetical protein
MIKEYSQNRNNAILNFSTNYCKTPNELLESIAFNKVLNSYIETLEKQSSALLERIASFSLDKNISEALSELFKLLIVLDTKEIKGLNKTYEELLNHKEDIIDFIEGLYNYWRSLERYALIQKETITSGIEHSRFISESTKFSNLILQVYRRIEENIQGFEHNVYRQLKAGINAGIVLSHVDTQLPSKYKKFDRINFINKIILMPPFIMYPGENKREGLFEEVFENPLSKLNIHQDHYFCFPAKVGEFLAFVYFHRDFMNHGISLANLFTLAKQEEIENQKPDLIYVFGARLDNQKRETVFYDDKETDTLVGYVSNTENVDYFGYMKKMILTLHNVKMLNKNHLPIHGAMVNITLKNGISKNIAIMGDSGAGKSESLEAFRTLSEDYLKEMKIIFDDMGTFKVINGEVYGYGTEIGAFVRLDDLDIGYSFKQMDRAIFMNPNRINARLLLPVTTHEAISKGFKVDIFLYANNYVDEDNVLSFFEDLTEAKTVFTNGARMAKGTTQEKGIVTSYFANPFGLVQRKTQTDPIISNIFEALYQTNVEVGQIYTKLAIPGMEQKGPNYAAKALFKWINSEKQSSK